MLILLSPLFVQLMHTDYYKIVKQLKSLKIIIVAPTCFGLPKPSSGIIYCISAVVTQHIKSAVLLQLVTFGYMFRPLPGHHQANKE